MIDVVQRLLAQKASNSATAFAMAKKLGFKVSPDAIKWVLDHTRQRPSNPYDVSFLISSARRITEKMQTNKPFEKAEVAYDKQHQNANTVRAGAFRESKSQGPIVGWYAHYDSKTSPTCRLANGNNFDSMQGTVIGYPGSVHPHCRCYAGPPHPNGQWVDDVLQATPVGV